MMDTNGNDTQKKKHGKMLNEHIEAERAIAKIQKEKPTYQELCKKIYGIYGHNVDNADSLERNLRRYRTGETTPTDFHLDALADHYKIAPVVFKEDHITTLFITHLNILKMAYEFFEGKASEIDLGKTGINETTEAVISVSERWESDWIKINKKKENGDDITTDALILYKDGITFISLLDAYYRHLAEISNRILYEFNLSADETLASLKNDFPDNEAHTHTETNASSKKLSDMNVYALFGLDSEAHLWDILEALHQVIQGYSQL
jgi:hypothetical protein